MQRLNSAAPIHTFPVQRVQALVLDWAGTTVDHGSLAPARTLQKLFAGAGIALDEAEARRHMGLPKREHIRGILSLPRVAAAWREGHGGLPGDADVEAMYAAFIPLQFSCLVEHSTMIPGVAEAVRGFRRRGLKIGSTTGYTRAMLDVLVERAAAQGYSPDCSLTPEEAGGGRPHPFMMYAAAIRMQVYPPAAMVKVGDTPADIEEGLNAGAWAVGVAGTGNRLGVSREEWEALPRAERAARLEDARAELARAGAHYVVNTLAELDAVLDDIDARLKPPARLFTPGPLTTSFGVKAAMLRDAGSRDRDFIEMVRDIRRRLLEIGSGRGDYECVLMQGSGTAAIESVVSSVIPREGRLLVLVNGAYGRRLAQMARVHGIATETLEGPENRAMASGEVAERLGSAPGFTHLAAIHSETTSGIVNPVAEIGAVAARADVVYIVDAMSSFGAFPINLPEAGIDFLVSSANKCIEGVPGFAFVLARRARLLEAKGRARTLSLDLHAQWAGLETDGQFRFTPPTHALLAFHRALLEFEAEGGVAGRRARYLANHAALMHGAAEMGLEPYLAPEDQSPIITVFLYPRDPRFSFEELYTRLSRLGFVIYPGKLTTEPCFRIGTIGRLYPADVEALVTAMRQVFGEMGIAMAPRPAAAVV